MQWFTTTSGEQMVSKNFLGNPLVLPAIVGAPSVVKPHNLEGSSWNFSINFKTVEYILAMSKNSSIISKLSVTPCTNTTNCIVSFTLVSSSIAKLYTAHLVVLSFKVFLIFSESWLILHNTVKWEKLVLGFVCNHFPSIQLCLKVHGVQNRCIHLTHKFSFNVAAPRRLEVPGAFLQKKHFTF